MGQRQVRISDELADRLSLQGGSLSAAAERTLSWALDTIDAADDDPEPARESAQDGHAPRAGNRGGTRTSSQSARNARYFGAAARRMR